MNHFNYASLNAELVFPYDVHVQAENVWFRSQKLVGSVQSRHAQLDAICTVEHEFFHCRSVLTTTFGFPLYYSHQVVKTFKAETMEHYFGLVASATPLDSRSMQFDTHIGRLLPASIATTAFLNNPTAANWALLISQTGRPGKGVVPEPYDKMFPFLSMVQKPDREELIQGTPSVSVDNMMESFALWKEYQLATLLLLRRDPKNFYDFSESFAARRFPSLQHRVAADLILRMVGVGFKDFVTGVILDIALCPPIHGAREITWGEFHPVNRLVSILRALAGKLPPWAKGGSYTRVPSDAYHQIDALVCKALGWSSASDNVAGQLLWLQSSIESSSKCLEQLPEKSPELLAGLIPHLIECWFLALLTQKQKKMSLFIWPTGSREALMDPQLQSYPLLAVYADRVVTNDYVFNGRTIALHEYMVHSVVHAFLDEFINRSTMPVTEFTFARNLYRKVRMWMETEGLAFYARRLGDDFEQFISEIIGQDWPTYCRRRGSITFNL